MLSSLYRLRITCAASVLLCGVVPSASPLLGQEVGVYGAAGRTELRELGALQGYGGYFRVAPLRFLSLRANLYRHAAHAIEREGLVCNNYTLGFKCDTEHIRNASALRGASVVASLLLPMGKIVEVEIGGGLSLNEISASERTTSGRPSFLVYGKSAQAGVLGRATVRARPLPRLPVYVDASVDLHRVSMNGCSTDTRAHAPYCGSQSLREWRLGLGYLLW